MFFSRFDKLLVVFLFFVVGLVFVVSALNSVDLSKPYHFLQQISKSSTDLTSIDSDNDGIIDLANWAIDANKSELIFCDGEYKPVVNCSIFLNANQNNGVPSGTIVMWSGSVSNIPTGWKLCDGTNGTPDLRGKFVVGYDPRDTNYNTIGEVGGLKNVTLSLNQIPLHSHSATSTETSAGAHTHSLTGGSTSSAGSHSHKYNTQYGSTTASGNANQAATPKYSDKTTGSAGSHTHSLTGSTSSAGAHSHVVTTTVANSGGGQSHENRPPYYTIAFIMKE